MTATRVDAGRYCKRCQARTPRRRFVVRRPDRSVLHEFETCAQCHEADD